MNYISTRNSTNSFKFKDVFIKGLADDGGLYIPKSLHKYTQKDLKSFEEPSGSGYPWARVGTGRTTLWARPVPTRAHAVVTPRGSRWARALF